MGRKLLEDRGKTSNLHKGLRLDVWESMAGVQEMVGVRLGLIRAA